MTVDSTTPSTISESARLSQAKSFVGRLRNWAAIALMTTAPIVGSSQYPTSHQEHSSIEETKDQINIIRERALLYLRCLSYNVDMIVWNNNFAQYEPTLNRMAQASSVEEALEAAKYIVPNYQHLNADSASFCRQLLAAKPVNENFLDFVESLLTGKKGNFDLQGMQVVLKDKTDSAQNSHAWNNRHVSRLSLDLLHTFIHELGHALAHKACGDSKITMNIHTNDGSGECKAEEQNKTALQDSFISAAGPIFHMGSIAAATFFLNKLSVNHPFLAATLTVPLMHEAAEEARYVVSSAVAGDKGDFGCIRNNSWAHLAVSAGAFATVTAGIAYLATQIFKNAYSR